MIRVHSIRRDIWEKFGRHTICRNLVDVRIQEAVWYPTLYLVRDAIKNPILNSVEDSIYNLNHEIRFK